MADSILTLTTDFGGDGPYVAAVKGVILGLVPGTQIVDVSHAIAPQDVAEGAFVLASVVDAFPAGTVHLAVVDPGVGTDRRILAVEARGQWFVLPDNGLIDGVLRGHAPRRIWEVRNPRFRRSNLATTFHGRDIMAPAAAHLLMGGDPGELGPVVDDPVGLAPLEPTVVGEDLVGQVVFVDSFGNLITNIGRGHLGSMPLASGTVEVLGHAIEGLVATYGHRPAGSIVALIGSSDWLEVAVVNGNAAKQLGASRGTTVVIRRQWESTA